jgi:hypothetical protein
MKTSKLAGIAVTIGLLIGLPAGYQINRVFTKGEMVLGQMLVGAEYSSFSLLQYEQADAQHAREALLGFIGFSKTIDRLADGQREKTLLLDVGSSYVRLARLEAQAGNADLSQQYVSLAQESFKAAGHDYSRDDLMKRVAKV